MIDEPSINPSGSTAPKVRWWHWLIGVALSLLFTFLAPRGKSPEFAHLVEGSVSQTKIIAPFSFEILKSREELEQERKDAAETVLPVVVRIDSIGDMYTRELLRFAGESHSILAQIPQGFFSSSDDTVEKETDIVDTDSTVSVIPSDSVVIADVRNELFNRFGFRFAGDSWRFLLTLYKLDRKEAPGIFFRFVESNLVSILRDIYSQGIVNVPKTQLQHKSSSVMIQHHGEEMVVEIDDLFTPGDALKRIQLLLPDRMGESGFPKGAVSAAYDIIQPFLAANTYYDATETERRRQVAIDKVPLAHGFVKDNELIIDKNHVVKPEHVAKLRSLANKRRELELDRGGFKALLSVLGYLLLICAAISFLGIYIALVRPGVWSEWKLIVLVGLVVGLIHIFQVYVPIYYGLSSYLFPVAVAAMLIGILVDRGVAIAAVIFIALMTGLLRSNDFPAAFTTLLVGVSAVLAIRHVKTRADIMRAMFFLAVVYVPLVIAFHFMQFSSTSALWNDLAIAGVNTIVSPILVLGLVFILENLFRITTDLSLLELVDLNRPLLRELAIKSPGTYHHSIMVGSLAEAAARAIGANALLTRAGAYYHDIGKMEKREYFIENQEAGSENIHDKLPPSKSAAILIEHVNRGLELADQYHLPEQVKSFISEHHGRSKLSYFYAKAKSEIGDDVSDERFRYPGPNPQSKEAGILMLADVTEAAVRSAEIETQHELRHMVDNLIRQRLADDDLEDCPLTLKEIGLIRDTFVQVLSGIHHHRIPYPGQEKPVKGTSENEQQTSVGGGE